jgi:TRAP-type C4-dicarboxylate transport system permease small subunit
MNSTSIDAPIARKTLESISRPFHIYFFLVMALLGSCLLIAGMACGGLSWLEHTTLPDATVMLLLGIGCFAFFFPYFLCLYCCRVLLRAVRDLEQKVESLSHDA